MLAMYVKDCIIDELSATDPLKSGISLKSKHELTQSQEMLKLPAGRAIHKKASHVKTRIQQGNA